MYYFLKYFIIKLCFKNKLKIRLNFKNLNHQLNNSKFSHLSSKLHLIF